MGIKNLKYLIHKYAANAVCEKQLSNYNNKILAIDTSIYLYRFIYKSGDPIELFARQILRLMKNGIIPLYIFDGKPPKEKNDVLDERNVRKKELIDKQVQLKTLIDNKLSEDVDGIDDKLKDISLESLTEELEKTEKRIIVINHKIIMDCKNLFTFMGVPFIEANGEAEALCADLIKRGHIYGCISEDTDILANGGRYFIRNFNVNNNKVVEYDLDKILEMFGIDYLQFIDICILCGCDYTTTIKNIGIEKAYKFIKEYGNIEGVINFIKEEKKEARYVVSEDFDFVKARELFEICDDNCDKYLGNMRLKKPQIESLMKFIGERTGSLVKNDIKRNLNKYYNMIMKNCEDKLVEEKCIDSYFTKVV